MVVGLNYTRIEWIIGPDGKRGFTWNPITGCLNHKEGLCLGGGFPCYAYRLANGRLRARYLANHHIIPYFLRDSNWPNYPVPSKDPFFPRFWHDRELALQSMPKNKGVFVCDMSDLFGIGVPTGWTARVLDEIEPCGDGRFYLLTKQPQRLREFSPFPSNCWVGVTATSGPTAVRALDAIYMVKGTKIFLSLEPLLQWDIDCDIMARNLQSQQVDWVIIGGQTMPQKNPELGWIVEVAKACYIAGVPLFLNDNLNHVVPFKWSGRIESALLRTKDGRLRQEVPR